MKKISLIFVLFLSFTLTGCTNNKTTETDLQENKIVEYVCEKDKTVLEILETKADNVEYTTYDVGVFITSINNIENNNETGDYWIYSIDDKMADVASDKYICVGDENIKWEYGVEYPAE